MDIFTIQEEAYKRGYEAGVKSVTDNNVAYKLKATDKDTNVLTNADRIRAMSDEELEVFLVDVDLEKVGSPFITEWGKWLKQPVED